MLDAALKALAALTVGGIGWLALSTLIAAGWQRIASNKGEGE